MNKLKYFLQYLKDYRSYLYNAFMADIWGIKNGMNMTFKERLDFYKWNSWSRYKEVFNYRLSKNNKLYLIPYDQI